MTGGRKASATAGEAGEPLRPAVQLPPAVQSPSAGLSPSAAHSPHVAAAAASPGRGFRASTGLKYLAGFFGGGVGISAIYAVTGQGLPCPFRVVTGWDCPLCGGTRLGTALLHGDIAAAFAFNPVVFVGLIAVTVLGLLWIVEVLGGPRVRLPAPAATAARALSPTRWLIVAGVFAVFYTLARNLL